ncbi:hypothetical protein [Micromonospora sp. NBC_01638]|uniref:hypothetical protein n=1 Tax=Micromonospora sp. NBC_01638 TaxID=2975982 RepID=UPI0038690180|nr:hypothetical protein OG811_15120 [Micromonospora sp. NBC_01638]
MTQGHHLNRTTDTQQLRAEHGQVMPDGSEASVYTIPDKGHSWPEVGVLRPAPRRS